MAVLGTVKHAWNAFFNQPIAEPIRSGGYGISYSSRPHIIRPNASTERSIIASIYTRLSIDVASTQIRHVRLDENDRYKEEVVSGLNECLSVEANIDQAASQFVQDLVLTLFEEGVAAAVPIDTTFNPAESTGFDIKTMRVGRIVEWKPAYIRVNVYNERSGRREDLLLAKRHVAIIENPFYSVMNEPNSTLQRVIRKINLLDVIDEQSGSGKLDLIIQLPYVIKSEAKKQQAEQRRTDIEMQLRGSKYGIAYADGTEKITQLNRPVENNLLAQIEYLMTMLYSQLGLTKEVMEGTADEAAMLNYHFRTVEPIVRAIVESMKRAFLTKTARTQKQSIVAWNDPFKLVPISQIAEMADKFARNEVLSSNEIRGLIGFKPSPEARADQLLNSNMPAPSESPATPSIPMEGDSQNGSS